MHQVYCFKLIHLGFRVNIGVYLNSQGFIIPYLPLTCQQDYTALMSEIILNKIKVHIEKY